MYNINIDYKFDIEVEIFDFKKVKESRGVYFIYDWENELCYVGRSRELQKRLYNHMTASESNLYQFRYLLKNVKVLYTNNDTDTAILERYFINNLRPYLNKHYFSHIEEIESDLLIEKANFYKKQWMYKLNSITNSNMYNRKDKIQRMCNNIKEYIQQNDIELPMSLRSMNNESINNFMKKHWNDQREDIIKAFKLNNFELYIDENDKRKTKLIKYIEDAQLCNLAEHQA